MPAIQGKVRYVKVGNNLAVAKIQEDGTGEEEAVPLWVLLPGDPKPSSYKQTVQKMQISLLSEALVNGLSVIIEWDVPYGEELNVSLLAAP
jgi:hypothetical protein